jgi:hypothetical protein
VSGAGEKGRQARNVRFQKHIEKYKWKAMIGHRREKDLKEEIYKKSEKKAKKKKEDL